MGSYSIPNAPRDNKGIDKFLCDDYTFRENKVVDSYIGRGEWYGVIDNGKDRFVLVVLFWHEGGELWVKPMGETEGPFYYNCPMRLIEQLTPPINELSAEWREKVREKNGYGKLHLMSQSRKIFFKQNSSRFDETKTKDLKKLNRYVDKRYGGYTEMFNFFYMDQSQYWGLNRNITGKLESATSDMEAELRAICNQKKWIVSKRDIHKIANTTLYEWRMGGATA